MLKIDNVNIEVTTLVIGKVIMNITPKHTSHTHITLVTYMVEPSIKPWIASTRIAMHGQTFFIWRGMGKYELHLSTYRRDIQGSFQ